MRNLFLILFFFVAGSLSEISAQIISTIAGIGVSGFSGDGGPATSAKLSGCPGVAVDGSGNIYISDAGNSRIRKVNTSGIITTVAGTGTPGYNGDGIAAVTAQINSANELAVDGSGNIYIADAFNNRIRKVNTSGIITTVAGNGAAGFSGDSGIATSAELNAPEGVAVDALGDLYISDSGNHRIRKVNTTGIITTIAGNGTPGYTGDGGLATMAEIGGSREIIVDGTGNIYIADGSTVRMINASGIITTIAGTGTQGFNGDGIPANTAEVNVALGVAKDGSGNIYISDDFNFRVRIVSPSGIINTVAGNGTAGYSGDAGLATTAQINYAEQIAIDANGNLYIADYQNNCIRKVTGPLGIVERINSDLVNTFPVPCSGQLTTSLHGNGFTGIKIYDMLGREVCNQHLDPYNQDLDLTIDFADLPCGIYVIQVVANRGIINKRIEVQR
ncbi:MAG: T9SS type A sorting domain-containing protein [Sphingobacteriales bacterium]